MGAQLGISRPQLVLDDQAVSAFVGEIASILDTVALACICNEKTQAVWSHEYQQETPSADDCVMGIDEVPSSPKKRPLGRGYYAYDFPLDCKSAMPHALSIVLYSVDAPSLNYVSHRIAPMLKCIARQLDIDNAMTTTVQCVSPKSTSDSVLAQLEDYEFNNPTSASYQEFIDLSRSRLDVECVAAIFPANKVLAISCADEFPKQTVGDLGTRLHNSLKKKRRMISAKITMANGDERRVICAPVLSSQNALNGFVLMIHPTLEAFHSKSVRTLSNKLATLQHGQQAQGALLDRFDLVSLIDTTMVAQPTLPHSLIYFDADKIHTINDAFGYSGGDRALATFRRILIDSAGANDAVAHLGSDRFAMLLPGASGDTAVSKAAQILRSLTQESLDDGNKSIQLSASAGVSDNTHLSKGGEELLILAEVAARGAKERGGNQCAQFQDIDSSIIQRRTDVDKVGFLQMALIENKFILHAQKIEAVNAEASQKFELLARLDDEAYPDSSPAQFLSAAERYQLMAALDRWVINSALTSLAEAENTLEVNLSTFCINVSAQSLQDDSFVDFIEARIAETGIPPDVLCFELTETSLVRYIDRAQRFVHRLQRLGCQVALDDFGTGYSSFAYLKVLPMDYLKIDGSFVRDLLENDLSKTIVTAVAQIADVIGAQTVAEHVENPMVRAWLRDAGINYLQGFAIHKPEPLAGILQQMNNAAGLFETEDESIDLRVDSLRSKSDTGVVLLNANDRSLK